MTGKNNNNIWISWPTYNINDTLYNNNLMVTVTSSTAFIRE